MVSNPRMPTTKTPDSTRATLLEAAFTEIHRHGFQAASLSRILADTGLTKGALYHHFPSKQALGLAVVDEVIHQRLEQNIFRPLKNSPRPLDTLLHLLEERIQARQHELVNLGCPLNNLMQEMSPLDPQFQAHLNKVLEAWVHSFESALKLAQAQGEIPAQVDCAAVALFIVSSLEGCIGIAKNRRSSEALRSCTHQLRCYIEHLRRPSL